MSTLLLGPVETFRTESKGRGVRCVEAVKKGTSILREEPFSCVLCNVQRGNYCDSCLLAPIDGKLSRCSGCKFANYCSKRCQKNAWIDHKQECKGLQRVAPNIPTDTVRLMARMLHRMKRTPEPATDVDERNFPLRVDHLEADVDALSDEKKAECASLFFVLQKYLGDETCMGKTAHNLLELFVSIQIYGFHIFDHEMTNIGSSMYIRASMINHSCEPNCLVIFDGPVIELRSIRDLEVGEECLITYIETLSPTTERRFVLQEQFLFECKCTRCINPSSDSLLKCAVCQKEGCNGLVKKFEDLSRCQECNMEYRDDDFWKKVEEAETKADVSLRAANEVRKENNMLLLAQNCLNYLDVLHPSHYIMLQARNIIMDAYIEMGEWERALQAGISNLDAYRHQYYFEHPSVGLQLMRIAKLQMYLGRLPQALQMLQQAKDVLDITNGPDHPLHKALMELLLSCGEEMRGQRLQQLALSEDG